MVLYSKLVARKVAWLLMSCCKQDFKETGASKDDYVLLFSRQAQQVNAKRDGEFHPLMLVLSFIQLIDET